MSVTLTYSRNYLMLVFITSSWPSSSGTKPLPPHVGHRRSSSEPFSTTPSQLQSGQVFMCASWGCYPSPAIISAGASLIRLLRHVRMMSALPPRADMCGAAAYVCFGPKADVIGYSITSLACASSAGGTVMSSALAVLRLIAISYLVGACTGRSPGFSPLRMRST